VHATDGATKRNKNKTSPQITRITQIRISIRVIRVNPRPIFLLALEVRTNEFHHVGDLRLRHLVFEGRHCFLAVRDHLGDLIVGVFDGVV